MQEVLNTLERHTVCTGTQCFESEEDAFGITTTPNGTPSNSIVASTSEKTARFRLFAGSSSAPSHATPYSATSTRSETSV